MSETESAAPTRSARWWWACVPVLLAVTGLVAAPPSGVTVALVALVLAATVVRVLLRPIRP